ncbi:MAG: hypothetical protein ACLRM8_00950 [Alistipes sp.]
MLTTAARVGPEQDTSKENFHRPKLLSQIGQAEAPDARPPDGRHSAFTARETSGLIRRIIDYYSRSNVDRTFEKKIDWSIAPDQLLST